MWSLLFLWLSLGVTVWAQTQSPNDRARFLAGLPPNAPDMAPWVNTGAFAEHAAAMNQSWAQKERVALSPIRAWAQTYEREFHGRSDPVFYFFSGPDLLYAQAFFPRASTYVLCGTEPVGSLPDLSALDPAAITSGLRDLRASLRTLLGFHYFITQEMRRDLSRSVFPGTLPVLAVLLSRMGCTLDEITLLRTPAPGVRIDLRSRSGQGQTVYYFKTDLSDGNSEGFLRWCAQFGTGMSLMKSDSYLIHTEAFSQCRKFLLEHSRLILQDDSGIPLRAFDRRWEVRFFGSYTGPIELFSKYHQPDLAEAYRQNRAGPLGFGFGYHWQISRSVLMLATRR